ncbi:MAG: hypothetical protein IRY91_05235 [Gemmatimonadaceae bacterium]|nr:hypothetical protein [Gemmatimonadaceae bacterium]
MSFLSAVRRAGGLTCAALLVLGCSDGAEPFRPPANAAADTLYWTLAADVGGAVLSTVAPYDTFRLVVTPRDKHGNVIQGLGPVTFHSVDPARVEVSADGLVRAHAATNGEGVEIKAELAAGNTRHETSVYINVVDSDTPPVLTTTLLMGAGVVGDTVRWPVTGDGSSLQIRGDGSAQYSPFNVLYWFPMDEYGNPIVDLLGWATPSNPQPALVVGGMPLFYLLPRTMGRTMLTFHGAIFGAPVTASVYVDITMPAFGVVKIKSVAAGLGGETRIVFDSPDITIIPGGTVVWANVSGQPVDIVFDDSTHVAAHGSLVSCANAGAADPGGAGNIAPFGEPQDLTAPHLTSGNCRSRSFPTPGTYTYHSPLTGATGQIIVTDSLPSS